MICSHGQMFMDQGEQQSWSREWNSGTLTLGTLFPALLWCSGSSVVLGLTLDLYLPDMCSSPTALFFFQSILKLQHE